MKLESPKTAMTLLAALTILGSAAAWGKTPADSWVAPSACEVNCIEVLEEGDYRHVFFLDAGGARTHLSTAPIAQDLVVFDEAKAVRLSDNVRRFPVVEATSAGFPDHAIEKLAGCGVDGWGWSAGEVMWSLEVANTTSSAGRTITNARAAYTARGRGVLFTTTTLIPPNGGPTSSTRTEPIDAAIRDGASGCERAVVK